MRTEEFAHPPTEAEARAAFVARAAGAAADAGVLLDRATALLPSVVDGGSGGSGRDEDRLEAALAGLAAHAATRHSTVGGRPVTARWGLDLVTGALRQVPAGQLAIPGDQDTARPPGHPPVGVAAGLTWVYALEAGLTQHCEALLARRLADPGTRVPRVCVAGTCDGRCVSGLCASGVTGPARQLYEAGEPVAHDLSGLLSLQACAIRVGRRPDTVVAIGATWAAAVRGAVERTLRSLPPHARGPHTLPAIRPEQELPSPAGRPTAPVRWTRPLDALRAQGLSPVAVLLDQDPRVTEVLPYLVHVVLLCG
ncbi:hypothetical protein EDD90_8706 [Streptomyces sp. Ag109_O5-1]|uniref:hypothetical protein n=1 Tax=Streptomyces sp. Ag109_O5-1 TaxID=1938851 RepID=UPI000F50F460|nr:hypothetical protein [Streptomyces sp. Ag109_O5-1]RPE45433.1 hypothetical protein EDD90_8706 [Streptomyces sp. Ag109_O5-1]